MDKSFEHAPCENAIHLSFRKLKRLYRSDLLKYSDLDTPRDDDDLGELYEIHLITR